jgi:alpha-beta hydrolase superfamily lysophospholipase
MDLRVPDYKEKGKSVQLFDYRYPQVGEKPRAVVQWIHGFGDYSGRYAYLGK